MTVRPPWAEVGQQAGQHKGEDGNGPSVSGGGLEMLESAPRPLLNKQSIAALRSKAPVEKTAACFPPRVIRTWLVSRRKSTRWAAQIARNDMKPLECGFGRLRRPGEPTKGRGRRPCARLSLASRQRRFSSRHCCGNASSNSSVRAGGRMQVCWSGASPRLQAPPVSIF